MDFSTDTMKPCLILITGLPASGKSSFSGYAAQRLKLPLLEKDHYKEILFDDIGFKSREEKVKLGVAAMNIMYDQARQLLKMGHSVILDNNFENSSLPGVKKLVSDTGCKLITVRFEDDIEAIYRRFLRRDRDPRRHPGHVSNSCYPGPAEPEEYVPLSLEEFERKFRQRGMMDFYPGGWLIRVNVNSFKNFSNEKTLRRLRTAMEVLAND